LAFFEVKNAFGLGQASEVLASIPLRWMGFKVGEKQLVKKFIA